jgi:phosphatidylserine decarboxylase
MKIHKEGYSILLWLFVGLTVLNLSLWLFLPGYSALGYGVLAFSILFFLLILQFFRHPIRSIHVDENIVLAPADGKVVVIEEVVETEYFKGPRRQISVFMSPINVHVNRNPVSGVITYLHYHAGKYLVAWHPKASTENERTSIVIRTPKGEEVLFRQIAGALAKRIRWYISPGDAVVQGEEFGFIKFGSRVDVFLPLSAKVEVSLNQKSIGGKTILARLH